MPRWTSLMGACLLLILTACCPLTSDHPLGMVQDAQYDARLTGAWRLDAADGEPAFVHLAKADGNRIQVLALEQKQNGRMEWAAFTVFGIAKAGDRYLNIDLKEVDTEEARNHEGYILIRYSLPDKNTLVLERLRLQAVVAAIQKGELAGTITYESPEKKASGNVLKQPSAASAAKASCARITDSTANLSRFFAARNPPQLFTPYLTLKRIQ